MMAKSLAELRALTDDELIERHDRQAQKTHVGLNYWEDELNRRYQERHSGAMHRYTQWVTLMTAIVTVATLVNVGIAATMFVLK